MSVDDDDGISLPPWEWDGDLTTSEEEEEEEEEDDDDDCRRAAVGGGDRSKRTEGEGGSGLSLPDACDRSKRTEGEG